MKEDTLIQLKDKIIDFIMNGSSSIKVRKDMPLVRAIDLEHIQSKLYMDGDIGLVKYVSEYLDDRDIEEMQFYNDMNQFATLKDSLNPHREDEYSKYFVSSIGGNPTSQWKKLESLMQKDSDGELVLKKKAKSPTGIFHIGEKGSGKTLTQNVWLYKNNKALEDNKIFWVRLDASKLEKLWQDCPNRKSRITTENYLLGQMLYVFCKHFQKEHTNNYSPLFGEIAAKLKDSPINDISKPFTDSKAKIREESEEEQLSFSAGRRNIRSIIDYMVYIEKTIAVYENTYSGEHSRRNDWEKTDPDKSFFIERVLREAQSTKNHRLYRVWCAIARRLHSFLLDNGYYILYIIDGVDSLDFFLRDRNRIIEDMLVQLLDFPLQKSNPEAELVMMSLRDTTYETLMEIYHRDYCGEPRCRDIKHFHRIRQEACNLFPHILKKRMEYMYEKSHIKDSKCFMSKALKCIQQNNLMKNEDVWHSNFRCFLNNHLSLAKLITYKYYFAGKPQNFDIHEQVSIYEEDNFLLNGEIVPCINIARSNLGGYCFNIFNDTMDKKPLYGLCTRILLIIKNNPNKTTYAQLENIVKVYNCIESEFHDLVKRLISSGMISPTYESNDTLFDITLKGEYVLELFYNRISFLYHAALSTYVPEELIKMYRISPNNYESTKREERFFPAASIITGAIFLQYLIGRNKKEIRNTALKLKQSGICNPSHINTLPIQKDKLGESILNMLKIAEKDPKNIEIIKEFIQQN